MDDVVRRSAYDAVEGCTYPASGKPEVADEIASECKQDEPTNTGTTGNSINPTLSSTPLQAPAQSRSACSVPVSPLSSLLAVKVLRSTAKNMGGGCFDYGFCGGFGTASA